VKEKNSVELVEQNRGVYFSIDSKDRKKYHYYKRSGILQRRLDPENTSRSIELNHPSEAKALLDTNVKAAALALREKENPFHSAKALRDNDRIFNALTQLKPMEWKVVFRSNQTDRILIKPGVKPQKNRFDYSGILIKLRLKDQRSFIEVGEGSVQSSRFNQDGLISRITKIVENHRSCVPHTFHDKVPVILGAGDGAIIFHEILGHSLEADYIYLRQSPITPQHIGTSIVSNHVTLSARDPMDTFFKNVECDDEGEKSENPVLVENGILRRLISDCFHKKRLNITDCGHCRVEDFAHKPLPRMYALYVKPGEYDPEELIESTSYGVYADEFGEGKVFFEKNLFYFFIRDAWLIKNGKISDPLGSIIVRGNIFEVLNSVAMVANDFRYDKGVSYCIKNGQTVNVRVGQPTVKINNLYVTNEFND